MQKVTDFRSPRCFSSLDSICVRFLVLFLSFFSSLPHFIFLCFPLSHTARFRFYYSPQLLSISSFFWLFSTAISNRVFNLIDVDIGLQSSVRQCSSIHFSLIVAATREAKTKQYQPNQTSRHSLSEKKPTLETLTIRRATSKFMKIPIKMANISVT